MRWEVSSFAAAILRVVASRICLKQYIESLCSSYLAFYPCFLITSLCCIHTVVLKKPLLRRNQVLFYQRSDFNIIEYLSIIVHTIPLCKFATLEFGVG